ncbi:hypothetical protein Y1Q_0019962 [Alligator mississippiensis]|uniref:Uncharacterized protein n=1 Tax=Alligator mississippiensis TaxID=8496 RepID=A0A151PDT9_ALLMI|nr:hypothetical protein Y1Q_0019962 [Alligator mississippiensis]
MVAFCDVDIPGGVELFPGKNGENTSRKENACCDGIGDNQASELAGEFFLGKFFRNDIHLRRVFSPQYNRITRKI